MAPSATVDITDVVSKSAAKPEKVDKNKTPLQAISHGDELPDRRHQLIHMAATFRFFARAGFCEGQSGHISVRDPEFPGMIWMNPLSRHFGMLTAGDMLLLDLDTGRIAAGRGNPTTHRRTSNEAGFFIHRAVHRARPHNIHAVAHAHTMAGRAWAAFDKPLDMLTQDICTLYNKIAVYSAYGGIVFADEEGQNIAKALGPENSAAILMSHGLLTVGETVDEAGFLFGLLDRSCQIQLQVEQAAANGHLKKQIITDEEAAFNARMAHEPNILYREAQPDIEFEIEAAGGEDVLAKGFDELVISQ